MELLIYAVYPALAALLLFGVKIIRNDEEITGFMSAGQSKQLAGFFSVCIMLHHISQSAAESSRSGAVNAHGLGVFFPTGYLFVSFFLFCSGFGLMKSLKTKENYMSGFGGRRILPVVTSFLLTNIIFLIVRVRMGNAELPANPYSWYVYTIVILYICFYFTAGKMKKGGIIALTALTALYCAACWVFAPGEWWFNSVPAFLAGLLAAEHEAVLIRRLKQRYTVSLILLCLAFAAAFILSENIQAVYLLLGGAVEYDTIRIARPFLQMTASGLFGYIIFVLGMKVRVNNACLRFLGSMTLEFYLIHGLFVQLFSRNFIDIETPSPLYISSLPLYTAAVLCCSLLSAFALNKLLGFIVPFLKDWEFGKVLWKDAKKAAAVLCALAVVITVFSAINGHRTASRMKEPTESYRGENITCADAGGDQLAAYITGSGGKTIVLLGPEESVCPTMELRAFADELSDKYRVVVFDLPGQGFSPGSDTRYLSDAIAEKVHAGLVSLGIKEPVVLCACSASGCYALSYIRNYPGEVSGLIGIDAYMPHISRHIFADHFGSDEEYTWQLRRNARRQRAVCDLLRVTGNIRLFTPLYDTMFSGGAKREYLDVLNEMFAQGYYGAAAEEERGNTYMNCLQADEISLPGDMPVLLMLSNEYNSGKFKRIYGYSIEESYRAALTNTSIQKTQAINNIYMIYYNPKPVALAIKEFLG